MHLEKHQLRSNSLSLVKKHLGPPSHRKTAVIPPEVLYQILGDVVAGFIDLAITKPTERRESRAARALGDELDEDLESDSDDGSDCTDGSDATTDHGSEDSDEGDDLLTWEELEAADELPNGTIIALLSVSYPFRDVTLKVLSDTLCIKRRADGSLSRNPWTFLKTIRRIYRLGKCNRLTNADAKSHPLSPALLAYIRLSYSEFALRSMGSPDQCASKITKKGIRGLETDITDMGISQIKHHGLRARLQERLRDLRLRWHVVLHLHGHSHSLSNAYQRVLQKSEQNEDCLDLALELHGMRHCTGGCENVAETPHGSPTFSQDLILLSGAMDVLADIVDDLPYEDLSSVAFDLLHLWLNLPEEQPYLNLE